VASCKIPSVVLVLFEEPGHPCAEKGARVGAIEVPPICVRGTCIEFRGLQRRIVTLNSTPRALGPFIEFRSLHGRVISM
jgi:hypothetical protein